MIKAKKDSLFHNINLSQEELESRSSMGLIDKVHCPILLIHDKEAKSGLVEQSYLLRDKLKKGNKEYEIKEFEIQGMQERRKIFIQYQTYYHIDDFFKRKYALDKDNIIIKTHNKTKAELITKTKLDSLISNLDLSKYIFSDRVLIKEGLRSKSNPFLTIATQHNHNDYLLLATFLHEQIHWYCKTKVLQRKITQLIKRKFPDFPIGLDKGSGRNEFDTYIHFPVNYFEYKALIEFSGKKKARSTLLSRDIYSRIYQTIFDNEEYFDSLFSKKS